MAYKSTADFVNEYPCPCGDGIYRTEEWVGDWGGSREAWTMVCKKCRPNYAVFEYAYADKGRQWTARTWITRDQERALQQLQARIRTAAEDTLAQAEAKYIESWMALARGAANKKQLWAALYDGADTPSPSLSTFYKHIRQGGLERHWRREFSIRHLRRIMEVLRVADGDVEADLERIDSMHAEQAALEESYRRSGFE